MMMRSWKFRQSLRYQVSRNDRIASALSISVVLTTTFLQKLALPGSNGALPITILLVPIILAVGLATKVLLLSRNAYIPFAILLTIGLCDFIESDGISTSLPSLALFAVVQSSLIFRFADTISIATPLHAFFRNVILILAVLGIAQFAIQFIFGAHIAFFLDNLPAGVIVRNFNVLNRLAWNSPIFKSNGVFLLEPSFLSQLTAIGIALEIVTRRNYFRLLVLGIAALVSFSGTGLLMLAIFLPIYALSKGQYRILILACLLAAAVFVAAEPLGLTALTSRINEFGSRGSSGWARFASPLVYLQDAAFQGPWSFLLGQGPGSVEQIKALDYEAFDPTWAKLLYEYGFLGFAAYSALFYSVFIRSRMPLKFPFGYTYFLLGGYLLNPSVVGQLSVMVVWTGMQGFAKVGQSSLGQTLPEQPVRLRPQEALSDDYR